MIQFCKQSRFRRLLQSKEPVNIRCEQGSCDKLVLERFRIPDQSKKPDDRSDHLQPGDTEFRRLQYDNPDHHRRRHKFLPRRQCDTAVRHQLCDSPVLRQLHGRIHHHRLCDTADLHRLCDKIVHHRQLYSAADHPDVCYKLPELVFLRKLLLKELLNIPGEKDSAYTHDGLDDRYKPVSLVKSNIPVWLGFGYKLCGKDDRYKLVW